MYLHISELTARAHLGKEVEQWLSYEQQSEYNFIRWMSIGKDGNQFTVAYFESFDEGSNDFLDVHEFSVLNPEDNPHGITNEFDSVDEAIEFAIENYGATAEKFVAGGMIQKEYANHLRQT